MKIQSILLARLAVAKPRKLFSITKNELDLKSRFVILIQTKWIDVRVSRKEQRNPLFVGIMLVNQADDANFAFE